MINKEADKSDEIICKYSLDQHTPGAPGVIVKYLFGRNELKWSFSPICLTVIPGLGLCLDEEARISNELSSPKLEQRRKVMYSLMVPFSIVDLPSPPPPLQYKTAVFVLQWSAILRFVGREEHLGYLAYCIFCYKYILLTMQILNHILTR